MPTRGTTFKQDSLRAKASRKGLAKRGLRIYLPPRRRKEGEGHVKAVL